MVERCPDKTEVLGPIPSTRTPVPQRSALATGQAMNPVRDVEIYNPLMAQSKKDSCRFGRLWTAYGSAVRTISVVGYYSSNQMANPGAVAASGASYL